MKHVLFIGIILTYLLNACSPQTIPTVDPVQAQASVIAAANTMVAMTMNPISTIIPTVHISEPSSTSFVIPKGDFEMSWNIYNKEYYSSGDIVTIRRQGSKYTEKIVTSDGSGGTFDLNVISEGSVIKLSGHFGDPYSLYPHDYIQVESNGWLGFYDDRGYIYGVPPLK